MGKVLTQTNAIPKQRKMKLSDWRQMKVQLSFTRAHVKELKIMPYKSLSWDSKLQGRMEANVLGVATPSLCPNKFYDRIEIFCLISINLF